MKYRALTKEATFRSHAKDSVLYDQTPETEERLYMQGHIPLGNGRSMSVSVDSGYDSDQD